MLPRDFSLRVTLETAQRPGWPRRRGGALPAEPEAGAARSGSCPREPERVGAVCVHVVSRSLLS